MFTKVGEAAGSGGRFAVRLAQLLIISILSRYAPVARCLRQYIGGRRWKTAYIRAQLVYICVFFFSMAGGAVLHCAQRFLCHSSLARLNETVAESARIYLLFSASLSFLAHLLLVRRSFGNGKSRI
jgi:hypothetical protein